MPITFLVTPLKLIIAILLALIMSCDKQTSAPTKAAPGTITPPIATVQPEQPITPAPTSYIEQGDLNSLTGRKVIRLLAPRWEDSGLPRQGLPSHEYRLLAEKFVRSLGLKPQWVLTESIAELIPALVEGRGDIIITHLTQTESRAQAVAFSLPISKAREQIIQAKGAKAQTQADALSGKRIIVPAGSSFVESLEGYKTQHELSFQVTEHTHLADPDTLIDMINTSEFDLTVLDNTVSDTLGTYRDDFSVGLTISKTRPIAWATRTTSTHLLTKLNQFLTESLVSQSKNTTHLGDFNDIKARKTLRVLTRNSPSNYFLWRGELMGFEYELIKGFADKHKLQLHMKVVPFEYDLIDWLKQGRGDLIAASMTATAEREARGVQFTHAYNKVNEQLVGNNNLPPLNSLDALHERTLTIPKQLAFWETATKLQQNLEATTPFYLVSAEQGLGSQSILSAVAKGSLEATISDSHLVAIESTFNNKLVPGLLLEPARAHGWAVRPKNTKLLSELNTYIDRNYRGLTFNILNNKYFKNKKRIDKYQGQRQVNTDVLSPYDQHIKVLADQYQFDWRLIVAQTYQESKFNPKAVSFAGATGLLQVMPRTAKEMGYELPFSNESGLSAGVQYLDWVRDRFEEHLPLDERLWFTLAAYNAGFGHVRDARQLAKKQGWNPDKWFNNVEKAMLLLSKRKYHSHSRFGYVRGQEPVNYVRQISERYLAYLALDEQNQPKNSAQ